MKPISPLALAAALAMSGAILTSPASAQSTGANAPQAGQAAAPQRKFNFSKEARKALGELQTAANAGDAATFPAKLAAAQAAAKNADDRYFVAQMQLTYAVKTNDEAGKAAAVDAIIASGGALPDELPKLYRAQGDLAINAKDYDRATAAYAKVLETQPGDTVVLNNLVVIARERKNYPQALSLLQKSIAVAKASGQPAPESLYRLAMQTALDGKLNSQLLPMTREFLGAYPTPKNWQLAMDIYRQSAGSDDALLLDTFRLMRSAKTLERPSEYIALADALARGRYYAEARDVVNEGVRAGKFQASNPSAAAILKEVSPRIESDKAALASLEGKARADARGEAAMKLADGYYGHGDYAKAAELYRLALQKGGVDANLVNTRLGMTLAMAGQRPAAEAAFKAVTGPRADLAGFWLLWLSSRA
jgi:tetratricopeptide (TPR) repeat protein